MIYSPSPGKTLSSRQSKLHLSCAESDNLMFCFYLSESSKDLSKCLITIFERCIWGEIQISKKQYSVLYQAFEKRTWQKSLRNNWIYSKKGVICKRNVTRHEKAKYKKFLCEPYLLNEGGKCTLHQEFFENVDGSLKNVLPCIVFGNI